MPFHPVYPLRWRLLVRIALLAALGTLPLTGARASVIEIGADGATSIVSGGPSQTAFEAVMATGDATAAYTASVTNSTAPAAYVEAVTRIALAQDISPVLLEALIWQESRWDAAAVSRAGAVGLAQLMPATARQFGVDARDPIANLEAGARYLRQQLDLFDGNVELALAAYNAGPARVLRAHAIPPIPETRAYVAAIMARVSAMSMRAS